MKQYLLSTYQPDTLPPASVDIDEIMRDVAALSSTTTCTRRARPPSYAWTVAMC